MKRPLRFAGFEASPGMVGAVFGLLASAVLVVLATPAVGFGDAGELGAAAASFGIAHPTGFPVALVWAHLFECIPFGPLAFRHALSSAVAGGVCIGVLCSIVSRVVADGWGGWLGSAVVTATMLGWATTRDAFVGMEVYALASLWVALAARESFGKRRPALSCLYVGLGVGTHVVAVLGTALFVVPWMRSPRRLVRFAPLFVVGALTTVYLPIASANQPALDWGDPETLSRFWEHLSASRIRSAFADANPSRALLLDHLLELAALSIPAAYGAFRHRAARWLVVLVAMDVIYAAMINPMGIPERQVGHLAGLGIALLAGLGVGSGIADLGRRSALRWPAVFCAGLLAVFSLAAIRDHQHSAHAVEELYVRALTAAPPRAVILCGTDDACAALLLARYGTGLRPDTDVLVPHHLWEPRDRARLRSALRELPTFTSTDRPVTAQARLRLVDESMRELMSPALGRPVSSQDAVPGARVTPAGLLELGLAESTLWAGIEAFDDRARAATPRGARAQALWARGFEQLGRVALAEQQPSAAAAAFRGAVQMAPQRAVGWSNLSVALARADDLTGAVQAAEAAVDLDPTRVVGWVNLIRYRAGSGDLDGAREAFERAERAGVRDPRLNALRPQLES